MLHILNQSPGNIQITCTQLVHICYKRGFNGFCKELTFFFANKSLVTFDHQQSVLLVTAVALGLTHLALLVFVVHLQYFRITQNPEMDFALIFRK